MDLNTALIKFLLVISLGALMGLERDESWKDKEDLKDLNRKTREASKKFSFITAAIPSSNLGGVRTYVLVSVLGAVTGLAYLNGVYPVVWLTTGGFILFIHIAFVLNYFDKNAFGLTTEISLILNFVLSLLLFATDIPTKIIVLIAVLDAVVLSMKSQVRVIISKFSRDEVLATIKFVLFTSVIMPFMPNRLYGPADIPIFGDLFQKILSQDFLEATRIFNPSHIWAIIVLVLGLNFIGYFASKALGKDKGVNMVGLLGGLVSSTAVTEAMARHSRAATDIGSKQTFLTAAILANLTSFMREIFVAILLNFALGSALFLPFSLMGLTLLLSVTLINIKKFTSTSRKTPKGSTPEELGINFKSPFTPGPALAFGLLYLSVITISKVTLYYIGDSGFLLSSMIAAMSGLDAITVTAATLVGTDITVNIGVTVMVVAACVNLLVKVLFASISGDNYFRSKIAKIFLITMFVGILTLVYIVKI
ncbi:MgtC/SapB family protein [Candidatus Nomurabacteria bacterium]|nr:MgtC/SapB family protein [Candidatus Nomurabacteria bacterium]MCB9803580.1 MgtC/SapB family protein [Candidatus Nomurabacteria bacterium]